MFFSQGISGILVCSIIFILTILNILFSTKVKRFYKELFEDLEKNKKSSVVNFATKTVGDTYNSFKASTTKGVNSINTQVIIQENIPQQYLTGEKVLEYLQSLVIILGLFGTFIGLTMSISSIKVILTGLQGTDSSIGEFLSKMSVPLASMSTAFYTSISGIAASIVIKFIGLYTYKPAKERYLDAIESYLDNIVTGEYSIDYIKALTNTTRNLDRNVKNMCDNITTAFEKSFEGFGQKSVALSSQLLKSAQTLDTTTQGFNSTLGTFNSTVNALNRPVLSFKSSVDKFESYYEGVSTEIAALDKVVSSLALQFKANAEALKDNRDAIL